MKPSAGVRAIRSSSSRRPRWAAIAKRPYSTKLPASTRSARFSRAVRPPAAWRRATASGRAASSVSARRASSSARSARSSAPPPGPPATSALFEQVRQRLHRSAESAAHEGAGDERDDPFRARRFHPGEFELDPRTAPLELGEAVRATGLALAVGALALLDDPLRGGRLDHLEGDPLARRGRVDLGFGDRADTAPRPFEAPVFVEPTHPALVVGEDVDVFEDLLAGTAYLDRDGDWIRHGGRILRAL